MNEWIERRAMINLYTFFVSKLLTSLGFGVFSFGISLYILQLTGSALSFATNIMFNVLPRALVAPLAGYVADRFPRKIIVVVSMAGITASIGALIIYTELYGISVAAIYTITAIFSMIGAFNGIAFSSSIPNMVGKHNVQKGMAFNQVSYSIGAIGGPTIGGMMYGFVSMEVFLWAMFVAYFIALCLEASMNFTLFADRLVAKKESMMASMRSGFVYLKSKPLVQSLLMTQVCINFFSAAISVGLIFVLVQRLSVESTQVGIIQGAGAIGMLVASLYLSMRGDLVRPLRFVKRAATVMCIAMICIAVPLVAGFSTSIAFIYYMLLMFIFSAMSIWANTPIGVVIQREVDDAHRGRVFGIIETLAVGIGPIGSLIYGALFDYIDASLIFIISGLLLLVMIYILLRASRLKHLSPL